MRYRPLGVTGVAVSAVSLALADSQARTRAQDWEQLVYAALESGINSFEVVGRSPTIADGLARAIHAIERNLVCIAWRMGASHPLSGQPHRDFSPEGLQRGVEDVLARTGFSYLDAIILDDPRSEELSLNALRRLTDARGDGRVRFLGVAGEGDAMDAYISSGAFNILCTPYSLVSGWKERLRLKAAIGQDMAIIGYDFHPEQFQRGGGAASAQKGGGSGPLAGAGTYAFLDRTPGWTSEAICLAYALTEPSLASIQIRTDRIERLTDLAAVPDRDLPTGVAAQIEMARFGPSGGAGGQRRA
jgi:aryl-alcohol dehydrogenase-like predicted oxidoreductase